VKKKDASIPYKILVHKSENGDTYLLTIVFHLGILGTWSNTYGIGKFLGTSIMMRFTLSLGSPARI
jgi:hypothetical protein